MEFKISKELIQELELLIQTKNDQQLEVLLNDMHHADIAEVLDELDFDEATSKSKTLRKPTETLQKVLSGGKVILRNLMTEIKTKESVAVGRTNSDTILLRITK